MTTAEAPTKTTGETIIDLTDQTFDRTQAHLDRYAQDPRRINKAGDLVLRATESLMYGPDHHYGFLALKICNREAEERVVNAIRDSSLFSRFFSLDSLTGPAQGDLTDRDNWQFEGWLPTFTVARDRYPAGNPDYRMWDRAQEGEFGERHKIGADLIALSTHRSLPLEERHTYSIALSHRFDKEEPELSGRHKVYISLGDRDNGRENYHDYSLRGDKHAAPPRERDVGEFQSFLGLARDLRPIAGGPDEITRFGKFITNLANEVGFSFPVDSEKTD